MKETFRQSSSIASSYAVAWDQYDSTTQSYNLELQLIDINSDGSFSPTSLLSPAITGLSGTGGTSVMVADTDLPAWDFKAGGGAYVLAIAEADSAANETLNLSGTYDAIRFQGYTISSGEVSTDTTGFTLLPDLAAYTADTDVSNEITQPIIASLSPYPGQAAEALQFTESGDNGNDYFVVWNETITSSGSPIGDQVEIAAIKPGGGSVTVEARAEIKIADGDAQNVRIGEFTDPNNSAQDDVVVVYGDDTGTHILEFAVINTGATVNQIADITDPTTQTFDNLTILGNGLIAITYDDLIDSSTGETSQYDFKLFDLAQQGLDNPTLSSTEANYIAGTQLNDTVTGVSGVNNLYYFVGLATTGDIAPADTFTGGASGTGWNIAIFPDARSDYTITTENGSGPPVITNIISNGDDPLHAGSLAVSNVQILAFDPVNDPTPRSNVIDVTGGTYVILGEEFAPLTIQAGATAELDITASGASTSPENVTFAEATGTLVLDQPNDFTGTISGISGSGDVLDLLGYNSSTIVTPGAYSGGDTTLTVSDSGHTTFSITLVGNYSDTAWLAATDASNTGVDIYDPPASAATIIAGGNLDITSASNETVTFTGGTGALVLNDPEGFTGQIVGFTGTAPDAAHSDTVDLVGIDYNSSQFTDTYNSSTSLLTVTDGTNTASITFDDFNATLDFASDDDGGTLITDPPAANSSGATSSGDTSGAPADWGMKFDDDKIALVSGQPQDQSGGADAGGADGQKALLVALYSGDDNFVFHHDLGAENVSLKPHEDAGELANHPDAQLAHQLAALITPDPHTEAMFDLIQNDIQIHHSAQAGHLLH